MNFAIIGASAIGCEFAYYFNAYGVEVSLFEIMDRIVPKEDRDISKELERQFSKQGIVSNTSIKITNVIKNKDSVTLDFEKSGEKSSKVFDKVLLGVGIQPNTEDLNLENAGIKTDKNGFIEVDNFSSNTKLASFDIHARCTNTS